MLIPEGKPGEFDAFGADYPSVIMDDNVYKMWYTGMDSQKESIGYAVSNSCDEESPPGSENTITYLPYVYEVHGRGPCYAYYNDDFSDPTSGWPIRDNESRKYAYINGEHQMLIKNPNSGWLVTPGARAIDYSVEVSAHRMSGNMGEYGIVFAINDDWSNFYELVIDENYYSIWRYDGSYRPLMFWTPSANINPGIAWNRIKIMRNGKTISLYIIDVHQTTVNDTYYPSFQGYGRIGLLAGSPKKTSNDVRFDDFYLSPYSCQTSLTEDGFYSGLPEVREAPLLPESSPRKRKSSCTHACKQPE